jgi:hypothetical protein
MKNGLKTPSLFKAGFLFALCRQNECYPSSTSFIKADELNTDSNQLHGSLDIV